LSLWLVPTAEDEGRYTALIGRLARRYGTPRFHPHLTLLGGVGHGDDALDAAERIAAEVPPFHIALTRVVTRPEYFRAVVVEAAPSLDLLYVHHLARHALDRLEDPAPFEPHLSLLYGHFHADVRRQLVAELPDVRARLRADRIAVWSTEGDPSRWHEVERFDLTGEDW
jgi:2'-5' RNA ligase